MNRIRSKKKILRSSDEGDIKIWEKLVWKLKRRKEDYGEGKRNKIFDKDCNMKLIIH